ncbi:MAG: hypothetical protein ACFB0B_09685 [Thermonemataceae bacterium]
MRISIIIVALLAFTACGEQQANGDDHHMDMANEEAKAVKVKLSSLENKEDPTCGMTLKEGAIADTLTVAGKTYGFCNPHCKEVYKETL